MEKLTQIFKNVIQKIKSMSKRNKIAFGVIFLGVIISIILFASYSSTNKYAILFSKLSADDGKMIADQLKADKVDVQIKGDTIYVPKTQVDSLRLELAPSITGGSEGYELFDSSNQFGMTDDEFKIKKLRATQGELEKTIKSFPEIENARVHLALPEESAFVTDNKPGKVAVYIQLKPGTKLSVEQIRAIASLISGSVDNVPKENVEIIDDKMNLLTQGIFDDNGGQTSSSSIEKQQDMESKFETKLENSINDLLVPVIGENKVKVKVNADMDFDSAEKTTIAYDPNKVIVSSHTIAEGDLGSADKITQSPVDNNMSNTITTGSAVNKNTSISHLENTYNFNVGQTETKSIIAPGEVKRLTASVMVDGNLDNITKSQIQQAVAAAIGYNAARGDAISVVSMNFDPTQKQAAAAEIQALKDQAANAKKSQLYKTIAASVGGLILFVIVLIFAIRSIRKRKSAMPKGIDVVIGNEVFEERIPNLSQFEPKHDDEKANVESDIKKYASEKPDQVADIIKSWLAEDER